MIDAVEASPVAASLLDGKIPGNPRSEIARIVEPEGLQVRQLREQFPRRANRELNRSVSEANRPNRDAPGIRRSLITGSVDSGPPPVVERACTERAAIETSREPPHPQIHHARFRARITRGYRTGSRLSPSAARPSM